MGSKLGCIFNTLLRVSRISTHFLGNNNFREQRKAQLVVLNTMTQKGNIKMCDKTCKESKANEIFPYPIEQVLISS